MPRAWYCYVGPGSPLDANSYILSPVKPTCTIGWTICAIYVPNGGIFPTAPLSANIQQYIIADLVTGLPQPQIGNRFFVYQKLT